MFLQWHVISHGYQNFWKLWKLEEEHIPDGRKKMENAKYIKHATN